MFLSAVPDRALLTMHENVIGQATIATDVVYSQILTVWQLAFARDLALIEAEEPLLEFLILVPVGDVDSAHAAVQAARGYKVESSIHVFLSFLFMDIFPHFILVQPYGIGIEADEFIYIHPVYCGFSLDPFLLAVYEDGLVLSSAPFFLPLLSRSKLTFLFFCHREVQRFPAGL